MMWEGERREDGHTAEQVSRWESKLVKALIAVAAVLALAAFSLIFRPRDLLPGKPLTEDGYYSLAVARHLALGRGLTYDGTVLTNGFQPLFTLLCAAAFSLAGEDRFTPLRLILFLHAVFYLASAGVMGLIARDAWAEKAEKKKLVFWLTAVLYLSGSFTFMTHFNGLETGFLLFLLACLGRFWQRKPAESLKEHIVVGIILGFIVLARVDAVFLVLIVSAGCAVRGKGIPGHIRFWRFVAVSLPAFLLSLPWWLYNWLWFGSLIPVSGRAQQFWAFYLRRLFVSFLALLQAGIPWIYFRRLPEELGAIVGGGAMVAGLYLFLRRSSRDFLWQETQKRAELRRALEWAGVILALVGVLALWYTLSSAAVHFYRRYYAPLLLPAVFISSYLVMNIGKRRLQLIGAVATFLPLPVVLGAVYFNSGLPSARNLMSAQLALVNERVPPGERVAAFQSGTLGYFRDGVVNLDGKVNPEALVFRGRLTEYLQKKDIHWVCDWPAKVNRLLGARAAAEGWREEAREGNFVLWHRP